MPLWIALLTESRVSFGEARVLALGDNGKPTASLHKARRFNSREEAEDGGCEAVWRPGRIAGWVVTAVPADGEGVPALPWAGDERPRD